MKFSLSKISLLKALSHGQSVVEKRTTIPILGHVLLKATKGKISFTTTDMDMALVESVDAEVESEGQTCVLASMLYEIVRKLSDRFLVQFTFIEKTSQMILESGKSRFELSCLSPEDFPKITTTHLTNYFKIESKKLLSMIDIARVSMSVEESRYNLNGIFFHNIDSFFRAVSTDMHRLSVCDTAAPDDSIGMPECIVGKKAVLEIKKLLEETDELITVGVSASRIEFSLANATLTARLVDGKFPDYKGVLNIPHDKIISCNTKEFQSAVDRVSSVVFERTRAVKLKFSKNKLTFMATSQDFGCAMDEMDVHFPNDEVVEISFNAKYLIDITQTIQSEEFEILFIDSSTSILIRPIHKTKLDIDYSFVLMPMRI